MAEQQKKSTATKDQAKENTTQQTTQQQQQQQQQQQKATTKKEQKSSPTEASASKPANKAEPVLTSAEIDRMIDLGLGRGIDSTDPKPWANKGAFQVRRVTAESVIGTEEGGALQGYEREVTSVTTHQTDLKTSVVVPQAPVQVGIDAEQSRTVSSTRRTIGKKVVNRNISFLSDFEDVPYASTSHTAVAYIRSTTDSKWSVQSDCYTFEERLGRWIVQRMLYRQEQRAQEKVALGTDPGNPKFKLNIMQGNKDPLSVLSTFIHVADTDERKEIVDDCYEFVNHFRITHYVSTIELGATEYCVMSEMEYTQKIKAGVKVGVDRIAKINSSHSSTWNRKRKSSNMKKIGSIGSDGRVGRGTYDEAVVGVKVQPISSLVKLPYLNLSLRKALLLYMDEQSDVSSGPFIIATVGERSLYWKVNDSDNTIFATPDIRTASFFFINHNDDGKHPYEFYITFKGDDIRILKKRISSISTISAAPIEQIPRYLSVSLAITGRDSGPLALKHSVSHKESRLYLNTRIQKKKSTANTDNWVNGREVFFIKSGRGKFHPSGYLCVRLVRQGETERWITSCVPSRHAHNDRDMHLLFRLLPTSRRESVVEKKQPTHSTQPHSGNMDYEQKLDRDLELLSKGSAPRKFRAPVVAISQPSIDIDDDQGATKKSTGLQHQMRVHFNTITSGGATPDV